MTLLLHLGLLTLLLHLLTLPTPLQQLLVLLPARPSATTAGIDAAQRCYQS